MNEAVQAAESYMELLPTIGIAVSSALAVFSVLYLARLLLGWYWLSRRKLVCLELMPPANVQKSPLATEELLTVLHGLRDTQTFKERLLGRYFSFSLEIVASKKQGIRYLIQCAEQDVTSIEKSVTTYLPGIQFNRAKVARQPTAKPSVLLFNQAGHFAYPLHVQQTQQLNDPLAYVTGAMTKLDKDEQMSLQVVVTPVHVRKAIALSKSLLGNEELLLRLGKRKTSVNPFSWIGALLFSILDGLGEMATPTKRTPHTSYDTQHRQQVAAKVKPARMLSVLEQELASAVHGKLNQPLFKTNVRVVIFTDDPKEKKHREKTVRAAFKAYDTPIYQSLRASRNYLANAHFALRQQLFTKRLPSLFARNSSLLSASELASLYHFQGKESQSENTVTSLSKTLPAPTSLKSGQKLDVLLANNHHHGETTPIGLTEKERERHIYIIGGTGNGKTTMLQYAMIQDIQNGKGMAFVDPHGDAAETLLRYLPKERINDVIYFNPDDLAHPIGLNLLELTPGLEGDELLREKDMVTEAVISVFRKIFSDEDNGGHRIEYVLRNSIQTALTVKDATIFTIFRLLNDPKYRKKITATLEDEDLKSFWKNELGKAGEFQRVKMSAGITTKIGRFLFSASAKRILEQPKSTINFEGVLDSGKVLICNFSKGLIGEDTSELFGITVLAKLQLAALRRARMQQTNRRPFYLYVDEFQNFATTSFVQLLSEARKYKLFLTMAEQSTSQQADQQMVNVILANVGTVVCFRSGNPADERLLLPLFKPYIEEGEIANLPSYNFYMRISAVHSQEPFSGETIVLEDEGSMAIAKKVKAVSRKNYAIKVFIKPKDEPKPQKVPKTSSEVLRQEKVVLNLPDQA